MRLLLHVLIGVAMVAGPARALAQPAQPSDADAANTADAANAARTDADATAADSDDDGSGLEKGTLTIQLRERAGAGAGASTGAAIDGAKIAIDAKPMGEIEDGELTLTNIPEGRHALVIEAHGYQRLEQTVELRNGQHHRLDIQLDRLPPPWHAPIWKWSLGASALVFASGLGYGLYAHGKMRTNNDAVIVVPSQKPDGSGPYASAFGVKPGDCGKSDEKIASENQSILVNPERFDRTCTWRNRSYLGYGIAAVGLVGAFVSTVVLWRDSAAQGDLPATIPRRRRDVRILPTVTPDGAGASLAVTW
jgi:PEGA domain